MAHSDKYFAKVKHLSCRNIPSEWKTGFSLTSVKYLELRDFLDESTALKFAGDIIQGSSAYEVIVGRYDPFNGDEVITTIKAVNEIKL